MANEALIRDRFSNPMDYTVADGTGIAKGALLKISDLRTAAIADGTGDVLAGIAAREKIADDGRTQLAVFYDGVFDMYASGAITVGAPVLSVLHFPNYVVEDLAGTASGAKVLGTALETAADGEQFQVKVKL